MASHCSDKYNFVKFVENKAKPEALKEFSDLVRRACVRRPKYSHKTYTYETTCGKIKETHALICRSTNFQTMGRQKLSVKCFCLCGADEKLQRKSMLKRKISFVVGFMWINICVCLATYADMAPTNVIGRCVAVILLIHCLYGVWFHSVKR